MADQLRWICPICEFEVPQAQNLWAAHVSREFHRRLAAEKGVPAELAGPEARGAPPIQYTCDTCDVSVFGYAEYERHNASVEHRTREEVSRAAESRSPSPPPQQSVPNPPEHQDVYVSHSDEVDFGTVEREVTPLPVITLSIRATRLRLRLSSASVQGNGFTILTPPPMQLKVGKTRDMSISFTPGTQTGTISASLRLNFQRHSNSTTFFVLRSLLAFVTPVVNNLQQAPETAFYDSVPCTKASDEYERFAISLKGTRGQRIEATASLMPSGLSEVEYDNFWAAVLFTEEHQMAEDLKMYDQENVSLEESGSLYFLDVPDLAERRPPVLWGDSVLVCIQNEPDNWCEGRVMELRDASLGLKFQENFCYRTGSSYLVRFTPSRIPFRRMHQALDIPFTHGRIFFPEISEGGDPRARRALGKTALPSLQTYNRLVATNPPQMAAIATILSRPAQSVPFIIFGPPGTGKTVTVVEAIRQVLKETGNRVLACAPSNSAADIIAQRLMILGPDELFRLNAPSRPIIDCPDDLIDYTCIDNNRRFSVRSRRELEKYRVVVSTCCSAAILYGIGIEAGFYTHIFVDEAGQGMEPEIAIPLKTMANEETHIILAGDPKQLGPIVRSPVASHFGLDVSLLERLMARRVYEDPVISGGSTMVTLTKNWKSHNAILSYPNEAFYHAALEACGPPEVVNCLLGSPILPNPTFPVVFHGVNGCDEREAGSPSYFNEAEKNVVMDFIERLLADKNHPVEPEEIGVISPYNGQARKLREAIKPRWHGVHIGTVEDFQAREYKVIVITTVRSNPSNMDRDGLGFLINPKRMNVALTRAKSLLIVVGNPNLLGLEPLWRNLWRYVYQNEGTTGLLPEWNTEDWGLDDEPGTRGDADVDDLMRVEDEGAWRVDQE